MSLDHLDPLAAQKALEDLARACGLSSGGSYSLRLPTTDDGEVPLAPLEWLRLEAVEFGIALSPFQASMAEVREWLRRDVPLLTALPSGDEQGRESTTWLLLTVAEDTEEVAVARYFQGEEVEELRIPFADLERELDLPADAELSWLSSEPTAAAASSAGASSTGEPLHPLRRLMLLVKPDRSDLVAVFAFAVAIGVLLLATPIAVQALVNFVMQAGGFQPLVVVTLGLFFALSLAGLFRAYQTWVVEILQRRIFVRTVADMGARLPRAAIGSGGKNTGAELVNRYFDLVTIQKGGSFLLLEGLSVLLSVLVGLLVLAFYHPLLLAFDVLLLAVIAVIVLGPIKKGIKTAKAESSAKYAMAAWLEEIASNPRMFKSAGVRKKIFQRTDTLARDYLANRESHFRIAFGQGVAAIALQVLASTALLGLGGMLVIQNSLTVGQLVAAELILTLVVSSVAKIGKHLETFYDVMAATDKVGMILDVPLERLDGEHHVHPSDPRGAALQVRSVSWGPNGKAMYKGVTFSAEPGDRVGIVGPTGSGKSMLLQLLWGLRQPKEGSILLDGRDMRESSLDSLRRVATLIDGIELISGTVRENVRLGRTFVTDDDVRSALRRVGLLDDLARLPDGIDTQLGPGGDPLSLGQVMLLQIARALAGSPRLLLVSDSLGLLPDEERERMLDILFDPDAAWTLVIVTNSSTTQRRCKQNVTLTAGSAGQPSSGASGSDDATGRASA